MPTSERKARANHSNAQKSTGPKSEAGKERARANALKHGLSGAGIVVTDAEAIAERSESWRSTFRIDSDVKEWTFTQVVVDSVRIDQIQSQVRAVRASEAQRATFVWAIDHEADAALLGDKLARKPEVVAKQLMKSKYGCEWLMSQWGDLRGMLEAGETLTDDQVQHAFDLAGIPQDARGESNLEDYQPLVESEYNRLDTLVEEAYDELDEFERLAAAHGKPMKVSKTVALLRRYETACLKRLQSGVKMLECTLVESTVMYAPALVVASRPPEPEPEPEPVVDEEAERAALEQWSREYAAKLDAYQASLAAPAPVQLRAALPTPAAPLAGMNRKKRRAMAKMAAQAK
jgi:hypothetical protein